MTQAPIYRNQSIDLLWQSMDWFLYDRNLRHEYSKGCLLIYSFSYSGKLKDSAHSKFAKGSCVAERVSNQNLNDRKNIDIMKHFIKLRRVFRTPANICD